MELAAYLVNPQIHQNPHSKTMEYSNNVNKYLRFSNNDKKWRPYTP